MLLPGVFLARPSVRAVVFAVVYSVDSVQCPHFYWNSFYPELTCVSLSFLGILKAQVYRRLGQAQNLQDGHGVEFLPNH